MANQDSFYSSSTITATESTTASLVGSGIIGASLVDSLSLFILSFDLLTPHNYQASFRITNDELSGNVDIIAFSYLESTSTATILAGFSDISALTGTNFINSSGVLPIGSYRFVGIAEAFVNDLGESAAAGFSVDFSVTPIPLPAALWLFGAGLLGLVGIARRKKVV